jgi:hypothetical protein
MIKSNLAYALYVMKGTQAHDIDANGNYLIFWWDNMGSNFPFGAWHGDGMFSGSPFTGSGTHVSHPGQAANNFVMTAWDKNRANETTEFLQAFRANFG